jgi:Fur family transcriptional regulator, zinc uptake regulator
MLLENDRHALATAETLCQSRGVKLTRARRQLLEILCESRRPLRAYELLARLEAVVGHTVQPPTVYRALEFLVAQRLVTRIESRNAYIACAHPDHSHHCVFFVCDGCGESREVENLPLQALVARDARAIGFRLFRAVVELQGICAHCVAPSARADS